MHPLILIWRIWGFRSQNFWHRFDTVDHSDILT